MRQAGAPEKHSLAQAEGPRAAISENMNTKKKNDKIAHFLGNQTEHKWTIMRLVNVLLYPFVNQLAFNSILGLATYPKELES